MTTIYGLSEDLRRSFLAGYALEEMDMHRLRNDSKKLEEVAARYPVPDAFIAGLGLLDRVIFVYSSDTVSQYQDSIERYDKFAAALNSKYGDIVLASDDHDAGIALGLSGYRRSAFSTVETRIKREGGTFDVTVTNLAGETAAEDAAVRERESDA